MAARKQRKTPAKSPAKKTLAAHTPMPVPFRMTALTAPSITVAVPSVPPHFTASVATELTAAELQIRNQAELRANAHAIQAVISESRAKNTSAAYTPKQNEFRAFCRRKGYVDGETVTEQKMLLFLVEDIVPRPLRRRGGKDKADPSVPTEAIGLSWRSVRTYVTAITDLYRAQKALSMNMHGTPREDSCWEYIKSLQCRDTERLKAAYADKGWDSLLDGYSEADLKRIAEALWRQTGSKAPECHIRTLVDMLFGHYMLSRGGDRCALEISDLFTFEFDGEGPTRCMPLIITMRGGKQNQHGRLETAGALWNRDPLVCTLGALGFYFLFRWDLTDEPFPDLSSRPRWYDIRLLKSTGPGAVATSELRYTSQRDWVNKAFKYTGIQSSKKTHIGRSSGAKTVELKGVDQEQIRRAGRWNQEQMVGCYLDCLPRQFMRVMAGHPAQMGCFEVRRARITPPETLLALIWPELNQWAGKFGPGPRQINDLAATGFTNLLLYLREVVLQDSVALMRQFPESAIWKHPVFEHDDYAPFAAQVAAVIDEGEQPSQLAVLTQALPVLTEYLQAAEARKAAQIAELSALILAQIQASESRLAGMYQAAVRNVLAGSFFQLQPPSFGSAPAAFLAPQVAFAPPVPSPLPSPSPSPSPSASSCSTPPATTPSPIPSASIPSPDMDLDPDLNAEPPKHTMDRETRSIVTLWHEWHEGYGGRPAIKALDQRWGSRWRADRRSEVQWYSVRHEVIREIGKVARADRCTEIQAAHRLEFERRQSGASIDKYVKRLRANNKLRKA